MFLWVSKLFWGPIILALQVFVGSKFVEGPNIFGSKFFEGIFFLQVCLLFNLSYLNLKIRLWTNLLPFKLQYLRNHLLDLAYILNQNSIKTGTYDHQCPLEDLFPLEYIIEMYIYFK